MRYLRGRSLRISPAGNCHIRIYRGGVHGVGIGAEFARLQIVAPRYGQNWFSRPEYQQIVSQLGATPVDLHQQRENRAERAAIPVIQDYFGKGARHGDMPKWIQQAIQDYQKAHPQ